MIRAAQTLAARTQAPVISLLENESVNGRVASFTPFWIANLIAVEAQPAVFSELALRADVGLIYPDGHAGLRDDDLEGIGPAPHPLAVDTLDAGLVAIDVVPAWNQGFTGIGRLVCDFDTGADGHHEALADRWRGAQPGVPWWAAWKDPFGNTQFPYDSAKHGTHTLGIMTAHPPGQDPLGVAYEAQWIAAGVLIGNDDSKIIECYQWAVDPDGNPSTINDVPDVINNSWGTSQDCDSTFWGAIDLVEAAGIVNTIAVDNTGPGPASVNSPESRAATLYRNFGVGNINPHIPGYPIVPSSGRGPSPCDMRSIKPEVTAPGFMIYSTLPGNQYGYMDGTSMACPHVSGAVAILRQVNQSLSVDSLKAILMETAVDHGDPGPDNTYGWGIIDVGAAVAWVLAHHPPTNPPQTLSALIVRQVDVNLVWQAPETILPDNPVVDYRVYRATGQDPYPTDPIAVIPVSSMSYTDTDRPSGTYRYVTTAEYQNGVESEPSNEVVVTIHAPAGVLSNSLSAPGAFRISPDPFGSMTVLHYNTIGSGPLAVEVYDAGGRKVRTLARSAPAAGEELLFVWNGRDDQGRAVPAGAYFATIQEGANRAERRMVVLR